MTTKSDADTLQQRIAECDPNKPVTMTCATCLTDYEVRFVDGQRVPPRHDCKKVRDVRT